ncbi:hypothetical protein CcaCcLH18_06650 [Colletotrichum camelliae]|nr:hypothetical protein CcaCcLH18_06650 [Colletotrichum camelliae]
MLFNCRAKPQPPPPPAPPPEPRFRCMYPHCTRKAVKCEQKAKGHHAMQSLYCKDHACRQRLDDMMCPSPKESSMAKYCNDHRRCQSEGCSQNRLLADVNSDWPYCEKHTCSSNGCRQKRSATAKMCISHTPLCLIPGCDTPRTDHGLYCPCHSCSDNDCTAVINGGHWCKEHRLCKTDGCEQGRAVTASGRFEDVCWNHLPKACLATGCKTIISGDVRFCPQHECMYTPCREAKDNTLDPSRLYCASHTCHHPSCPQPTSNPSSPSVARYCITHTCASPSCYHPSKPSSRHCALHACLAPSCPAPRTADPLAVSAAQFCSGHECLARNCFEAAGMNDSGYCDAAHACASPGCPVPRGPDGGGCCVMHAAIMARPPLSSTGATVGVGVGGREREVKYYSHMEETLGQRLRAERERHVAEMRLQDGGAWQAAGFERRRGRRERVRSCDSGYVGSPSVSDGSNCTFVS